MTSRQRAATSSVRRDATTLWHPNDSDSDRPRQTMATTQRHNIDQNVSSGSHHRHHTSSRRVDVSGAAAPYAPTSSHHKSSSKHRSSAAQPSSSYYPSVQSQNHTTAGTTPVATSQPRPQDTQPEDTRLHAYMKKRSEKRSPRSSNEHVALPGDSRSSRPAVQSRSAYATTAATVEAPSSTQTYWIGPAQSARDPSTPSRHHREHGEDRAKDKERRRDDRERDRTRSRDPDRERDKEKIRERERRREKEREKERTSRDKERHREREKPRDRETRHKDDRRVVERENAPLAPTQVPGSSTAQGTTYGGERPQTTTIGQYASQTAQQGSAEQIPMSSLMNAPSAATQMNTSTQPMTSSRPSDLTPRAIPIPLRVREKSSSRPHRSHRERLPGHQSGQESGMSSSEQEHSGRERYQSTDRRYATRDRVGEGHPSGPSGSETERGSLRERRKVGRPSAESAVQGRAADTLESSSRNTAALASQQSLASQTDPSGAWTQHAKQSSQTKDSPSQRPMGSIHLPASGMQMHTSVPPGGQPTLPVGLTSQRYKPQIVSIRAGQGPADPQTPVMLPKSSSTVAISRPQDPLADYTASHEINSRPQASTHAPQQSTAQVAATQPYGATVTPSYQNVVPTADGAKSSHQAASISQQIPAYTTAPSYRDQHSGQATPGYLHPVQQAIRSVEGILRPSSRVTHRSATAPPAATSAMQGFTTSHPVQGHVASVVQQLHSNSVDRSSRNPSSNANADGSHRHRSASQGPSVPQPHPAAGSSSPAIVQSTMQHSHPPHYHAAEIIRSPPPIQDPPGLSTNSQQIPYGVNSSATVRRKASTSNVTLAPPRQDSAYPSRVDDRLGAPQSATVSVQYTTSTYTQGKGQANDPRSPKPSSILPPVTQTVTVAQATFPPSSRTQSTPTHPKETTGQSLGAIVDAGNGTYNISGYSPSRNAQTMTRSPVISSVAPPTATPKHNPSTRLHYQRNGSSDTITQSPAPKPSPTIHSTMQPLTHRSSATNLQANAASRPDMTSASRPVNAGYPEPARYRSPAPAYPHHQAVSSTPVVSSSAASLPSQSQPYSIHTPLSSSRPNLYPNGFTPSSDYPHNAQRAPMTPAAQSAHVPASQHQQAPEYGLRSQEPPTGSSSTPAPPGQRVPPRTAPSPAPTINARQYYGVSSPASKPPSVLSPSHAQQSGNSTFPAHTSRNRPDPAPIQDPSHLRAASDPQYSATPNRLLPSSNSTSAHVKSRSETRAGPAPATEQELLLTPSSLAPSMLPRQLSSASTVAPEDARSSRDKPVKEKESRKKGSFFGLFRSRSSPPKDPEVRAAPTVPPAAAQQRYRKGSAPAVPSAHSNDTPGPTYAASPAVQGNVTPAPVRNNVPVPQNRATAPARSNAPPVNAPSGPVPVSGRKSPGSKMFTPFRLLSKRHRTVSAASVEAVDGTVANTLMTGADSTRSSTAGRLSPPLRDPLVAAQEWRNKEEAELMGRGTGRRRRPGVTFDVDGDLMTASRPPRRIPRRQPVPEE